MTACLAVANTLALLVSLVVFIPDATGTYSIADDYSVEFWLIGMLIFGFYVLISASLIILPAWLICRLVFAPMKMSVRHTILSSRVFWMAYANFLGSMTALIAIKMTEGEIPTLYSALSPEQQQPMPMIGYALYIFIFGVASAVGGWIVFRIGRPDLAKSVIAFE